MKKKGEFREPETVRIETMDLTDINAKDGYAWYYAKTLDIPSRIIGERDYQRLLKLAKKAAKRGK